GGAAAAAALGAWRFRGCVGASPHVAQDVVAVLPIEGERLLKDDPIRFTMTCDLHDALATSGIHLLPLHARGMDQSWGGPAMQVMSESDPTAAALARTRVTAVVRTRLTSRADDRFELEVTASGRNVDGYREKLARPAGQVPLLVMDVARAIA